MNDTERVTATPEQSRYADILFYGAWAGIFVMVITYLIYILGILDPHIPLQEIPKYWSMSADEYSHKADVPMGWGWATLLGTGDFINFLGIAFLGALTIVGYLTLLPAYLKKKDMPFFFICLVEVLVLLLAASGILGSGGH